MEREKIHTTENSDIENNWPGQDRVQVPCLDQASGSLPQSKLSFTTTVTPQSLTRQSGRIKWFNQVKGYGFIVQPDASEIFVHYTGLINPSDRIFTAGDNVSFELIPTGRGDQAVNVERF